MTNTVTIEIQYDRSDPTSRRDLANTLEALAMTVSENYPLNSHSLIPRPDKKASVRLRGCTCDAEEKNVLAHRNSCELRDDRYL